MTQSVFSERLVTAREGLGLGRTDMARRVYSPAQLPSIRDWELGGSLPRHDMLSTIARAYAIPLPELVAAYEDTLQARKAEAPIRPMCGDCPHWRPDGQRRQMPLVDIAVRMGWCAAYCTRRERCDWCLDDGK